MRIIDNAAVYIEPHAQSSLRAHAFLSRSTSSTSQFTPAAPRFCTHYEVNHLIDAEGDRQTGLHFHTQHRSRLERDLTIMSPATLTDGGNDQMAGIDEKLGAVAESSNASDAVCISSSSSVDFRTREGSIELCQNRKPDMSLWDTTVVIAALTCISIVSCMSTGSFTISLPFIAKDIKLANNFLLW